MVKAVVYIPQRENLNLAVALFSRARSVDARHVTQLAELDGALREHDASVMVIFAPRKLSDVGTMLLEVAKSVQRSNIALSVIGNAPTIEQFKRLKHAAITDYSILPLGPKQLTERLARAVTTKSGPQRSGPVRHAEPAPPEEDVPLTVIEEMFAGRVTSMTDGRRSN